MSTDLVPVSANVAELEALSPHAREVAVTRMLGEARSWLAHAVEATEPQRIAEFKAFVATVAETTRQLQLSREIQLDAQEMVRRAERGVGLVIRRGQESGQIARTGQGGGIPPRARGRADSTISLPTHFATTSELSGNGAGIYLLTDGVTDEAFDAGIDDAKAEGNLSRANVVRRVRQRAEAIGPDLSTPTGRRARIAELASQGYTSRQIGPMVGMLDQSVRDAARDAGINIPADKVVYRSRKHDPNRIVEETVHALDGLRMGHYYVIDGQHRVEALRQLGWGDQSIQCWTYSGLTEEQEAERFLKLNDTLAVDAFSKFKVAVQAGRGEECDIDRIVRASRLRVTLDKQPGAIRAVGTLKRIYSRSGPAILAQTLRICRDAYGDPGMEAAVLDGIGLLCQRYEGELGETRCMEKLAGAHGGVNGLLGRAENIRRQTGNPRGQCVAASAVEIYNSGKGGQKLPSWWKSGGD